MRIGHLVASACLLAGSATAASATTVLDAQGDYLASFTGPLNGDLDIRSASATFDGTSFILRSTQDAAVGTTLGSLFVWGVDRGTGTARLTLGTPSVGAGVLFDSVVVMLPDGTLRVATFPAAGPPTITVIPAGATVAGNSISATVPLALLFSTGFSPADYAFSLWSRARANPAVDGTNVEIADFAPNGSGFRANVVPEPATWLSMLLGFALLGSSLRHRRNQAKRHACAA